MLVRILVITCGARGARRVTAWAVDDLSAAPARGAGTLYVVASPIGEPEDLSARARQILSSVETIAAEDTRITRRLLQSLGVGFGRLVSYHDHNERSRAASLVARLEAGEQVALISDAGTPLVSDPGYRLVSAAVEARIPVVAVPGPCAAVAALSASGLPPDRFLVLGFLPREAGRRAALLEDYRRERATTVLYAAPHRVIDVLRDLQASWGERRVALARNLTKPSESWLRGTVGAVLRQLEDEAEADRVRGEITLVIQGADGIPAGDEAQVDALIAALVAAGVGVGVVRDVVARIYDRPRRWVYQRALSALDPGE